MGRRVEPCVICQGNRFYAAPDLTRTNLTGSVTAGDRTFQLAE